TGIASLERDNGVGQRFDALLMAALAIATGHLTRRGQDATDDGPEEDDDNRHHEKHDDGGAEPRLHAIAAGLQRQRAGQGDQPGGDGGDDQTADDPGSETDHGLTSPASAPARTVSRKRAASA